MANEKTNGHDPMTVRMVEVLERIEARLGSTENEIRGLRGEMNERLGRVEKRLETMDGRLEELVVHAHATNERFVAADRATAERFAQLEARVGTIEARLAT